MWYIYVIGILLVVMLLAWIDACHDDLELKQTSAGLSIFTCCLFFLPLVGRVLMMFDGVYLFVAVIAVVTLILCCFMPVGLVPFLLLSMLTCCLFFLPLVGRVLMMFGGVYPLVAVVTLMTLHLCAWICEGLGGGRKFGSAKGHLIFISVFLVLIAFVGLHSWYTSDSEVEDATVVDESLRYALKEKEMVQQHDLALKRAEKETVELLEKMAVLNASTQLQVANLSLQAKAVESDAKVQIAKTSAEKEIRIAELETQLKLAETDAKLKAEQMKISTDTESLTVKLEEARIEIIKLENELALKVAKAKEEEIMFAQEVAKIRELEATNKRQENMIEVLQLEMAKLKTEHEAMVSGRKQEDEFSSVAIAVVVIFISVVAIAFSTNSVECLRRARAAVREFLAAEVAGGKTNYHGPQQ